MSEKNKERCFGLARPLAPDTYLAEISLKSRLKESGIGVRERLAPALMASLTKAPELLLRDSALEDRCASTRPGH